MRRTIEHILSSLNPAQREAVVHTRGPLLVFAGAGSGKTRVLTHRIAYLIATREAAPEEILAMTFTNKAAEEMKERIGQLLGTDASRVWAGTFHSFCARLLRRHINLLGRANDFVIYDEGDQQALLKQAIEQLGLPKETNLSTWQYAIERAKDDLLSPDDLYRQAAGYFEQTLARLYQHYQDQLQKNNALDFDDLLIYAVRLLETNPALSERYHATYRYLLVDEFQDINYAQYRLVQALAGPEKNVMVVGDDDQSIYGWRGANVELILRFRDDFPQTKVVTLEQNYRSTQTILDAASHLIAHNSTRAPKRLWTERGPGKPILVFDAPNEQEEAHTVASFIEAALEQGRSCREFAVLYRTNAQSRVYEEAFLNRRIPYRLVGSLGFYERAEVKDILAYLRVLLNPADSVSLRRIINVPRRGIGDTTVSRLQTFALQQGMTLWQALLHASQHEEPLGRQAQKVAPLVNLFKNWREGMARWSLSRLVLHVIEDSGYKDFLERAGDRESLSRLENLDELVQAAATFERASPEPGDLLSAFLERVALLTSVDVAEAAGETVTLMTLHSAKGLEFHTVFIAGME